MSRRKPDFVATTTWHLLLLIAIMLSALCLLASEVPAQMDQRARTALGLVNTGGAIFDTARMQGTASAFAAAPPPLAGVTGTTIQDDTTLKLLSTGTDIQAYDGVQSRPRMVIEPTDPRLDPAKWASTTGVTTIGDLQTGTARSCTYSDFGSAPPFQRTCDRFRDFTTPSCKVPLNITGGADVQDTSSCSAYDGDPLCAPSALTCISGPGTRTIAGVDETRLCWEWQQDYFCHAATGQFTNCTPYEVGGGCTETGTTCLATAADGGCSHESVSFQCGNPSVAPPQTCTAIQVCQGTVCDGAPVTPDTDFAEAAAWINIADQTVWDNNLIGLTCAADAVAVGGDCPAVDIRFFEGTRLTCQRNGIFRDCCDGSGIATGLLGGCTTAEVQIQNAIRAGTVHTLGSYCSSSFLGVCLRRRNGFCEFNSKIARVFQQQARLQVGLSWDGPRDELCEGFSQAEMASINFDAIDLTELFSDMLATAGVSDPAAVEARLKSRLSGYFSAPSGDLVVPSADPNFDEANVSASADPITGTMTYTDADAGAVPALTYTGTATSPPVGSGPVSIDTTQPIGVATTIPTTISEGLASPQLSTARGP